MKKYINDVRNKSGYSNTSDASMMGDVFGKLLIVAKKYKKPDGTDFQESTKENIEEGQKFLSMGIVKGGRNPVHTKKLLT